MALFTKKNFIQRHEDDIVFVATMLAISGVYVWVYKKILRATVDMAKEIDT